MKQLYLIRHAKSSWADPSLDDFDRPLNGRGKRDGPVMAGRLGTLNLTPDLIVSSPARRARKTARMMAGGVGYKKSEIRYLDELYLGSLKTHLSLLESLRDQVDVLFLVGHNYSITELGEYLTDRVLENVPTTGVVAVEFDGTEPAGSWSGAGKLIFFDFPRNTGWTGY
jgi:phosphohistidine phosphatase